MIPNGKAPRGGDRAAGQRATARKVLACLCGVLASRITTKTRRARRKSGPGTSTSRRLGILNHDETTETTCTTNQPMKKISPCSSLRSRVAPNAGNDFVGSMGGQSFPRRRESSCSASCLDSRLCGNDAGERWESNAAAHRHVREQEWARLFVLTEAQRYRKVLAVCRVALAASATAV